MKRYAYIILAAVIFACKGPGEAEVSFNRDVRPILNDKCLRCHGGVKANGEFSMLFEEDAFGKTRSGEPAIVRGKHEKSEIYKRVVHEDPELRMPQDAEPLTQKEIDILAEWIDRGAKWEKHWAYIPPKEQIEPPVIDSAAWAKTPIDNFVFAKMIEKGLAPSQEADKAMLMRRLHLDLIGLPPTMEEIDLFMEDSSVDAYEKLVDRLLASSHFGERWATLWMDLARYADSKGYEKDTNREIWKYRDWLINAFNQDVPYDRFSIEQLAGDLLPDATEQQLIATAFHRNTLANDEGGTDNEEFRVVSVLDRVSTTYEVWQGTTMACVQCHSHPYDPFRHEEFYQSMAFFNNSEDRDIYFEQPKLFTYSEENKKKVEEILGYVNQTLKAEDRPPSNKSNILYDRKEELLHHLGYRKFEAEIFEDSSPFIELTIGLRSVDQIQDSSWVKYNNVNLTNVEQIGFTVASQLDDAGSIAIHIDSLNGKKIGEVGITKTGKWKSTADNTGLKEFKAEIEPINGSHMVYLRFYAGNTYAQNLFNLEKISYYEKNPRMANYGLDFRKKLNELYNMPTTTTPIIRELPKNEARNTHVFDRGSWLNLGEEVTPGIPNIYSFTEDEEPRDRLAFAQWMVSEQNPLSARVAVNRFWEQLFGFGLVESMEEFGSQGEKPTHPELLDWLAVRFMKNYEWRIKPLIRELVLSATYRQSSETNSEKIEKDVRNQWLARGHRTRLSSEQIRDQVLAVSGLLNQKIGGPSVENRDVDGGWRGVPEWTVKGDEARYRRSLYTLWKRVTPPSGMLTFDSSDRSVCVSRRIRTNTPLQALNLLNDETFFEASNALAEQILKSDSTLEKQLEYGYKKVMGRTLNEKKLALLKELYHDALGHYEKEIKTIDFPASASKLSGKERYDLAAMTVVANALLNLDEFVVKG